MRQRSVRPSQPDGKMLLDNKDEMQPDDNDEMPSTNKHENSEMLPASRGVKAEGPSVLRFVCSIERIPSVTPATTR